MGFPSTTFPPISFYGQTYPINHVHYVSFGWFDFEIETDVITDYVYRANRLLLEQFTGREKIQKLLEAYITEAQDLEYAIQNVRALRLLESASGVQLDQYAQFVGIERNGLPDNEFREAIKITIILNSSSGELGTVILAGQFLTGEDKVSVWDIPNATTIIFIRGPLPTTVTKRFMKKILAAGIQLYLYYLPNIQADKVIGWADEGSFPCPFNGLFKELNVDTSATDGYFVELIEELVYGG